MTVSLACRFGPLFCERKGRTSEARCTSHRRERVQAPDGQGLASKTAQTANLAVPVATFKIVQLCEFTNYQAGARPVMTLSFLNML